jgi:hypothetical protein
VRTTVTLDDEVAGANVFSIDGDLARLLGVRLINPLKSRQ